MSSEVKLDSLLERIYQDGVEKSNKKSEEIVSTANQNAKKIIDEANARAEAIIKEADQKVEELKRNTLSDIRMGGEQAISALKQRIKDLIVAKVAKEGMKEIFADSSFLKTLVLEVVKKWDKNADMSLCFSDNMKNDIDSAFINSIKDAVSKIEVNFDKKMSTGFKISEQGHGYELSFTDQNFVEFFSMFIKQKTEEIFFTK